MVMLMCVVEVEKSVKPEAQRGPAGVPLAKSIRTRRLELPGNARVHAPLRPPVYPSAIGHLQACEQPPRSSRRSGQLTTPAAQL